VKPCCSDYHSIWDVIATTIEAYGYSSNSNAANHHGLDKSKRPACSMFYVPCQAADKSKSFWKEFDGEYINPLTMVEYTIPDPVQYVPASTFKNPQSAEMKALRDAMIKKSDRSDGADQALKQDELKQNAIDKWRAASKGDGSRQFFIFSKRLKAAGLDAATIRSILFSEAAYLVNRFTKTVKQVDDEGNVTTTTVDRKPRKWFWLNQAGKYIVEMLYAGQPVLVNGKESAIVAGDLDGVEQVLNVLAEAVVKGVRGFPPPPCRAGRRR
jgi:hypothetical protein